MEGQANLISSFSTQTDWDDTKNRNSFPTGIAVSPVGDYVIADGPSIKIYDVKGALRDVITTEKIGDTHDVTVSRSGKIMTTDTKTGDVRVFSKHGKYLMTSESGHLVQPAGLHYDLDTCQTCVSDRGTSCVYVHDARGVVTQVLTGKKDAEQLVMTSRKFSKSTSSTSDVIELQSPNYVTMDKAKNIIVSDSDLNAIFCFNSTTGALLWRYGELGSDDHELQAPAGVCSNHHGNLLVADPGNCRVHLLDWRGRFLDYVLTWEDGVADPQAITINKHGHLVVTEPAESCVKVFNYLSQLHMGPSSEEHYNDRDDY